MLFTMHHASFFSIAADITVVIHLAWIVFLMFGAFIGRKYMWVKRIHIFGIALAIVLQIFGWYCPLTHLEVWLRKMHDPAQSYSGSFIIHYVEKVVYINLPPGMILVLTIVLALVSAWLYRPRGRRNLRK
ncbi:MAG: DUF2784 domain-containing protein [Nitrospiraceae bacterium]|nr:MAG: DUF2784 domain-containing protein [Nitrospiraceae bacterium]